MYFITKDNPDGTREVVKELNGTLEDAQREFSAIVKEQAYKYKVLKTIKKWRVIRLFDSESNQLAQES